MDKFNAAVKFYENIPAYQEIEQALTGVGMSCPVDTLIDTARISTDQMSGTLFMFGGIWLISLLLSIGNYMRCSALISVGYLEGEDGVPPGQTTGSSSELSMAADREIPRMLVQKVEAMEMGTTDRLSSSGSGGGEGEGDCNCVTLTKLMAKVDGQGGAGELESHYGDPPEAITTGRADGPGQSHVHIDGAIDIMTSLPEYVGPYTNRFSPEITSFSSVGRFNREGLHFRL